MWTQPLLWFHPPLVHIGLKVNSKAKKKKPFKNCRWVELELGMFYQSTVPKSRNGLWCLTFKSTRQRIFHINRSIWKSNSICWRGAPKALQTANKQTLKMDCQAWIHALGLRFWRSDTHQTFPPMFNMPVINTLKWKICFTSRLHHVVNTVNKNLNGCCWQESCHSSVHNS